MIPAWCGTNLDEYQNEVWPKAFIARPRVGDRVKSSKGRVLYILNICHCVRTTTDPYDPMTMGYSEPYIEVELGRMSKVR